MEAVSWSRLPEEMSERVLSFLPVPALCRCRSVCREWNELFRKASFLDLCDLNGANKPYLFVTRHLSPDDHGDGLSAVDDAYRLTTCFLDLGERRWYSIPADRSLLVSDENVLRLLAMDDGLVCELSALDEEYKLAVFDPVAKTRRELPASTPDGRPVVCQVGEIDLDIDSLPVIVTVADNADRSFKVFLMNRDSSGLYTGFFVYESSTDAWRCLGTPPEELGVRVGELPGRMLEESAVFFQGNLYAAFWYCDSNTNVLLSYNLEQDLWREVLVVDAENPKYPQLIVSGNRMVIAMWFIPHTSRPARPVFEIKEILVDENSSRSLVQIPNDDLEQISGESQFDIAYGFPLNSTCVVLVSRRTGRLLTYDLRSGAVGALPAHPLHLSQQAALKLEEEDLFPHYRAKLSNLSLRNILSVR